MSLEHEQTNLPPVHPEQLENPEVSGIQAREETTALGGVRQAITAFRISRTERRLERLKAEDHVIKHASVEAQEIRGFGSEPVSPEDAPIGFVERLASDHRHRQVKHIRHGQIERHRLSQVHEQPIAESPDIQSSLSQRPSPYGTAASSRWNSAREKLDVADRGVAASFDTTSRMSKSRRKAIKRAERNYFDIAHHVVDTQSKLDRGAAGDTRLARRRAARIERTERRRDKLERNLSGSPSLDTPQPDDPTPRNYPPRPSRQQAAPADRTRTRKARTERGRKWQEQQETNRKGVI